MYRSVKLVPPLEEIQFEYEDVSEQGAPELLDERARSRSGATYTTISTRDAGSWRLILTGCNDIVDDQDTLTRLDGITLYLENVLSVFLFEGCSFGGPR